METTNENIRQLLEMLDHPDAFTEQEIRDIIDRDDDTREVYHLMVEAKRSRRLHQDDNSIDVDAAWRKFKKDSLLNEELRMKNEESADAIPCMETDTSLFTLHSSLKKDSSLFTLHSSLKKVAALFIGMLLVSGIAFATIHIVRQQQEAKTTPSEQKDNTAKRIATIATYTIASDTVAHDLAPVTFDNLPLEKILQQIAEHYHVNVAFANDDARLLRFRFVWNPQLGIDQVVGDLNQFEHLNVNIKDNLITVE